jgi:3-oxoacyl-[acyl-carrier protein] reductase
MENDYRHEGKVALVVGATGTIGLPLARFLAEQGSVVYATAARRRKRLSELRAASKRVITCCPFDIGSKAQRKALLGRIASERATLDYLVIALGDFIQKRADDTTEKELLGLFSSNVVWPLALVAAAKPLLLTSRSPRVVLFGYSGIENLRARRFVSGYAAAKTALLIMARSLARDWGDENGISLSVISPGVISSPPLGESTNAPTTDVGEVIAAVDRALLGASLAEPGCTIIVNRRKAL